MLSDYLVLYLVNYTEISYLNSVMSNPIKGYNRHAVFIHSDPYESPIIIFRYL